MSNKKERSKVSTTVCTYSSNKTNMRNIQFVIDER